VLIPVYNHGEPVVEVVGDLVQYGLPCLLIDDGSDEATKAKLRELAVRFPWVELKTRSENGGKGAALKDGFRLAHSRGFSHVVQLDADGQHDTSDIPRLVDLMKRHPDAMVLVDPVWDNAPRSRRYGRLISTFWVWVECCSTVIRDPLCGYRCMPLAQAMRILDRVRCGDRMDFDPEIAVRMVWEGVPVINVQSRVSYDPDGVSHFDMWHDNVLISWRHTRLVFGMLARLPRLIGRRIEALR
jgi:glycosyltransferase involved in cell wall biosynthesis